MNYTITDTDNRKLTLEKKNEGLSLHLKSTIEIFMDIKPEERTRLYDLLGKDIRRELK